MLTLVAESKVVELATIIVRGKNVGVLTVMEASFFGEASLKSQWKSAFEGRWRYCTAFNFYPISFLLAAPSSEFAGPLCKRKLIPSGYSL